MADNNGHEQRDIKAQPKDANDLLQAMVAGGVCADDQRERVKGVLAAAAPMAVEAARWAGGLKGAERDAAIKTVFRMVGKMERMDRATYRTKISELLGIGVREFNDLVKAVTADGGRQTTEEVRETLGGFVDGWLIEYVYDPGEGTARLAFRDPERRVGTAEELVIEGVKYIPKYPTEHIKSGGVLLPSDLGALKPTRELTGIVEEFIHQHYLLESRFLGRIIAYYVMLTWVYDAFNALPYLRAMGEAGAGKSELMRRVGALCYRMITASGANTSATFFRATEMYKGTVFIDEADLQDGGDMANDIIKFLNLGAMKGNPITRTREVVSEAGKEFILEPFQTFCPKLIAMRRDFRDDAVGSRSLTIKLMPREPIELKARGIRLYIDEEFRQRARQIRNLLLRWRLQVWEPEIEAGEELMDLEISSRLNQVTMPIKALAKDDPELRAEMEKFLRAYNQEMVLTRSMTIAARVVEAMWKIYRYADLRAQHVSKTPAGEEYMMIGDVRVVANEIMDEMNRGPEGEEPPTPDPSPASGRGGKKKGGELTARGVGAIIRNELQLRVGVRQMKGYPVYWDEIKMQALGKRYGVNFEAIGISQQGNQATGDAESRDSRGESGTYVQNKF